MSIAKIKSLKAGDSVKFVACGEACKFDGIVVKNSKSVMFVKIPGFKMEPILFCRKTNVELFKHHDNNRFIKDFDGFIVLI